MNYKEEDWVNLRKKMKKVMDEKRYEHTLGVSYTAATLAMIFDEDIEKAKLAGLLHDCAKNMEHDKKIKLCKKNGYKPNQFELDNPSLLHARCGSILAKTKYNVDDEDVLNAICSHTTGRPGMSKLEQIIFIADFIEPGRKPWSGLDNVRRLSYEDLNKATCQILSDMLDYLNKDDKSIDPMTQKTYEYYSRLI